MNLPRPLANYLYQNQPLRPRGLEGQSITINRDFFQLDLMFNAKSEFDILALQTTHAHDLDLIRAWLMAHQQMVDSQLNARLLNYNAREVENFLRLDRMQPLWPIQPIPQEIQQLDQQVRSLWFEILLESVECQNSDDQSYIDRVVWLKRFCLDVTDRLQGHLNLELVALEREADFEFVVVSLDCSKSLQELLSEEEICQLLQRRVECVIERPFLKWVAEPRELP
jgi:hypothetical protein